NVALLDAAGLRGSAGDDTTLRQQLSAPAAAGSQPALVKAQQITVRRQRRPFADLGQYIDEAEKVFGQLGEDRRKGVCLVTAQGRIGRPANVDVVVDVHELAFERISKEPRGKEREIADLFEVRPLTNPGRVERFGEAEGQRRFVFFDG